MCELHARAAHLLHICAAKSEQIFTITLSARAATESCASWARTRRMCSSTRRVGTIESRLPTLSCHDEFTS